MYIYINIRAGGSILEVGPPSAEGARKLSGSVGMLPRKILKSNISVMPFPAFWGKILENYEDYKSL